MSQFWPTFLQPALAPRAARSARAAPSAPPASAFRASRRRAWTSGSWWWSVIGAWLLRSCATQAIVHPAAPRGLVGAKGDGPDAITKASVLANVVAAYPR